MNSEPVGSGPRLVYDAATDSGRKGPIPARSRIPWLAIPLVAALLLAFSQWQRAAGLEVRVEQLAGALVRAEAEIVARRAQLDGIRTSVADVRDRVAGLAALAAEEPTAPPPRPAKAEPAH